jgi:hypothetical protein
LDGFTDTPGSLDLLANINLLDDPPTSLTEIFERASNAIQTVQRADHRMEYAGNPEPETLSLVARKLAAATQVCQLPNIELPTETLRVPADAVSARLIAGSDLTERLLEQVLNSALFIDSGFHQVKVYPDPLAAFLGARRLNELVQSPEQARLLVQQFSWRAPSGESGVYKRFLPLMGWLATLNSHCREELLQLDPQAVAFFGDLRNPTVQASASKAALRAAIERLVVEGDRLGRGVYALTGENYWQAGSIPLESTVRKLFAEYGDHPTARTALLDIATKGKLDVLRAPVLSEARHDFGRLLKRDSDARYILALANPSDLAKFANAIKSGTDAHPSLTALVAARVAWSHLSASDIVRLAVQPFSSRLDTVPISYAVKNEIVEAASDVELFALCRGLVLAASKALRRNRQDPDDHSYFADQLIELAADVLGSLVERQGAGPARRIAQLLLLMQRNIQRAHSAQDASKSLFSALTKNADARRAALSLMTAAAGGDDDTLRFALYGYDSIIPVLPEDVRALNIPLLSAVASQRPQTLVSRAEQPRGRARSGSSLEFDPVVAEQVRAVLNELSHGTAKNVLIWIAKWLLQTNSGSRYGEVNFERFSELVDADISSAARSGLLNTWRLHAPEFNEGEPHSTHYITAAGLQGLNLEFGDGSQLPELTDEEVRRAVRYAVFEINGPPRWLWPLARAHARVTSSELKRIIRNRGAGLTSRDHAERVLASLPDAPGAVKTALATEAWEYLRHTPSIGQHTEERLLDVATTSSGRKREFESAALARIRATYRTPLDPPSAPEWSESQTLRWAAAWLFNHPRSFQLSISALLAKRGFDGSAFIRGIAAHLGANHQGRLHRLAQASDDGVRALAKLYEWCRKEVRESEDNVHTDGIPYSPNARDHAEDLRDSLVRTIASARSQLAYDLLEELRGAESQDRAIYIRSIQFDMREEQLTRPALSQRQYLEFERTLRGDVSDVSSLAMAVHSDLLAVKYDIEKGEYSLRRFFTDLELLKRGKVESEKAGLALEADFQRLLASELNHHAGGRYSVTLEPHTAEAKRRDVLCSIGDMRASIELKMSARWTVEKYIEALEKQLVGQYMRHSKATIGFLVIVLQESNRRWSNGDGKGRIDFDQLISMLRGRALALEAKRRELFLRVIGINATAPKSFRRQKEQSAKRIKPNRLRKNPRTGRAPAAKRRPSNSARRARGRNQTRLG